MNTRRGGLGRGLGALIPTAPRPDDLDRGGATAAARSEQAALGGASGTIRTDQSDTNTAGLMAVPGVTFAEIPVAKIRPNPRQPRQVFDDDALDELAHSLREVGFLQPVVVRRGTEAGTFELVMGERRWRAAQRAGLEQVPAIVREATDDTLLRDALLENLHREQLNPLEEGAAYAQLLDEFGATHEELAKRIGRSRSQVTNTIRLLNLPASVQRKVAAGVLAAGHARALLGLQDPEVQERLANRVVAEGLSVRAVEELVAVGDDAPDRPRRRAHRQHAPGLDHLAGTLSDHFETRVRVELGRSKGKITIEFASVDDLERIVATMAPQLSPAARPVS